MEISGNQIAALPFVILPSIFPFRVREGGQSNILTADVNLDKALAELGKSQKPEIALCVGNGGVASSLVMRC